MWFQVGLAASWPLCSENTSFIGAVLISQRAWGVVFREVGDFMEQAAALKTGDEVKLEWEQKTYILKIKIF